MRLAQEQVRAGCHQRNASGFGTLEIEPGELHPKGSQPGELGGGAFEFEGGGLHGDEWFHGRVIGLEQLQTHKTLAL